MMRVPAKLSSHESDKAAKKTDKFRLILMPTSVFLVDIGTVIMTNIDDIRRIMMTVMANGDRITKITTQLASNQTKMFCLKIVF